MISTLILLLGSLAASHIKSVEGNEATLPGLDDGPHVIWRNDTTAVVYSFTDGRLVQETFTSMDTVRFTGMLAGVETRFTIPVSAPSVAGHHFDTVGRFLAVSDVHGDFRRFREILVAAGVMDEGLGWTWGDGHLVVLGDIMDRGPAVTECLWLAYLLAQQAERAGGAVHFVLGNHELMVLLGDLRYVHQRYLDGICGETGMEYGDLFGPDTELGRWVRSRPSVLMLDGFLFVHGGIAPGSGVDQMSLPEINELVRLGLERSWEGCLTDGVELVFGSLGPLWFRGYHYGMEGLYPATSTDEVASLLERHGAERIIVGHTEHDSITALHGGRVLTIDVPVELTGGLQALLYRNGSLLRVNPDGTAVPVR